MDISIIFDENMKVQACIIKYLEAVYFRVDSLKVIFM